MERHVDDSCCSSNSGACFYQHAAQVRDLASLGLGLQSCARCHGLQAEFMAEIQTGSKPLAGSREGVCLEW